MSTSTLDRVIPIIVQAAHLAPDTRLDAGTTLIGAGLSLDSVAVLEVLLALEKEFGVELNAEEMAGPQALQSVGRLADFIQSKTGPPQ